ncbi:hypothetical protein C1X69_19610 [Pseudomonas sp. FW305-67]|nr:hypothetical protein C1X70_25015 [Pseudomonas sp. FW305-53]PMY91888.1 hypothetical protein C1X67_16020 [Pseudomonas sp. FW305-62]PNA88714.1 hypothetical protein C1X66_04750 [Pseudomonas sp. MPR-R3B]PNB18116.1 hypothetical protein C1X69_19610 [Pseudomonas sp. FW305-67]
MLPLGCVAAPKMRQALPIFVSAAHSSGSKLPRHKSCEGRYPGLWSKRGFDCDEALDTLQVAVHPVRIPVAR